MDCLISIGIISIIFLIISQIQFIFYKNDAINFILSLIVFFNFFKITNYELQKTIEILINLH